MYVQDKECKDIGTAITPNGTSLPALYGTVGTSANTLLSALMFATVPSFSDDKKKKPDKRNIPPSDDKKTRKKPDKRNIPPHLMTKREKSLIKEIYPPL